MKALTTFLCVSLSLSAVTHTAFAESVVTTSKAELLVTYPSQSAPAKVVALNQAMVPTQISAVLNKLPVKVGDKVNKGDLIAELDCQNYAIAENVEKARLEQASSQKAFSLREYQRGKKLAKQKNIGDAELDRRLTVNRDANAQFLSQQSNLLLAQLNVERCQIRAPFDGIVLKRSASVGEMLNIGNPVIELLQLSALEVSAKVAVSELMSFTNASSYSFVSANQNTPVSLRQLLPFVENNTRSQEARFHLAGSNVIVGSIGRLLWKSPKAHLPAHLLQTRSGKGGYFIEDGGKAKFVVVANAEEGRPIEFNANLSDSIIVDGRHGLNHGDTVNVVSTSQTEG